MDILIQRLENTDLSVELADEAPGAVNRQRLLDDAKRRWDLGFYKEALSLYRRAQGIQDDLSVAIKIGGLLLSQGCDPLAIEELETALQKFGDNPDETAEVVATASILLEMLRGQSRLRYRGALQLALQHFGTYVRPLPVSEWRDHKLRIFRLAANLHDILTIAKATVDPPPWDEGTLRELFHSLVQDKLFWDAYYVTGFHQKVAAAAGTDTPNLAEELISHPDVDPLVRGELLRTKASQSLADHNLEGFDHLTHQAEVIFRAEGHEANLLWLELQRLHDDERSKTRFTSEEVKTRTLRIKDRMTGLGDWRGVRQSMAKLASLAIEMADYELATRLDHEYDEMRAEGLMATIDWFDKEHLMLYTLTAKQSDTFPAKLVHSYTQLYEAFAGGDLSIYATVSAMKLYHIYQQIGDATNAALWASRVMFNGPTHDVPELHVAHPLAQRVYGLQGGTPRFLPLEEEISELSVYLANRSALVRRLDASPKDRYQLILGMFGVQTCYSRRPLDEYEQLSRPFFDCIRDLLPLLRERDRTVYTAQLLHHEAFFIWSKAILNESWREEGWDEILAAYNMQVEAAGLLESLLDTGSLNQPERNWLCTIYAALHNSTSALWNISAAPAGGSVSDELFLEADAYAQRLLDVNLQGFLDTRHLTHVRLNSMHSLWLQGLSMTIRKHGNDPTNPLVRQAMERTRELLARAREILEALRRDLSPPEEGAQSAESLTVPIVFAKQLTGGSDTARLLYHNAFVYGLMTKDATWLWRWVQESKARSVSDLLGLGTNIPQALREAIENSPETKQLFKEEETLRQRIAASEGPSRIFLHKQLTQLHEQMLQNSLADAVLALREGRPTTLDTLNEIAGQDVGRSPLAGARHANTPEYCQRRVVFVDYVFVSDNAYALVDVDGRIEYSRVEASKQQISAWKDKWLTPRPPTAADDEEDDEDDEINLPLGRKHGIQGLRWLALLIKPVIAASRPGDLLVLCPSGPLHGIPLHAAMVEPGSDSNDDTHLIERNPIVYTASMTVTQQCMTRALASSGSDSQEQTGAAHSILGVWFKPQPVNAMAQTMAASLPPNTNINIHVDSHLPKPTVQSICASSKTILFFGHCGQGDAEDPLSQHLLLHDTSDPQATKLTAADLFTTHYTASLTTLVACGSARQAIKPGDEPLGLVSAMLCAGGSSVVGTLWPVDARTGVAFAKIFYQRLGEAMAAAQTTGDKSTLEKSDAGERGEKDVSETTDGSSRAAVSRLIDLAVVLQQAILDLRKVRDPYPLDNVYDWGSFMLNGAWLMRA